MIVEPVDCRRLESPLVLSLPAGGEHFVCIYANSAAFNETVISRNSGADKRMRRVRHEAKAQQLKPTN
jgi:hypothetical protein